MIKQTFVIPTFSLFILSIALFHQHYLGMEPCAWCVLQRFFFALIFLSYFLSLVFKKIERQIIYLILIFSLSGIVTATYQTFWANYSQSCAISFAEKFISFTYLNKLLPFIFESYALCAESNVNFVGLPYSVWGLISFVILLGISIKYLYKPKNHSNQL